MNDKQLVTIEEGGRALAHTLVEIKHERDISAAAAKYAKAAKLGLEEQNYAAERKLRAERSAGQVLAALQREQLSGLKRGPFGNVAKRDSDYKATITEVGISYRDANRWQNVAAVPDWQFETYLERTKTAGKELTTTGVLRIANANRRQNRRDENSAIVANSAPVQAHVAGMQYQTIMLDPPWDWGDEGDHEQLGRGRPVYHTMPFEEIMELPVGELAKPDAHLYLWITNRSLPKGFSLIEQWGFRYITALTWCKPGIGMGNYFRGSSEHVLFAVRGSLSLLRHDIGTWFQAPRGKEHSSKPGEIYEIVESCSPGPWLELFARSARPGWVQWGAEIV